MFPFFSDCRTKTTTRLLDYVARRIIRTGLQNLGYRTKTTNWTLEFRLPDENYEPDFGIMLPDE
uniref:Uncharacterized protein n=1 Tax=Rhizophagus irregularis (strain DAOM 181602 / DAOM 197198 / MUCL 43194) TaxID=747089 RepID=U9U592_RHIID